ncbi:zinc finger C2H2-type domain-containing protein [Megavirus courdo7]|uniref:Zinc finger C2H2-type domain-containing protein n=1 Tax=Megavirus courdo7 TaxID=1128135 RepID=H6WBD2_9VIRU|nr:zinc finger C2H2-type domain-containing protein [Megavirus courdo7]
MSINTIKKLNTDQLLFLHDAIVILYYKKMQQSYDNESYPEKTPNDKLKCLICNGSYIRQKKSIHEKTKKHCKALNRKMHENVFCNYDSE